MINTDLPNHPTSEGPAPAPNGSPEPETGKSNGPNIYFQDRMDMYQGDEIQQLDGVNIYEHHRLVVDPGQEPTRVDVFLANRLKHFSRTRVKNAAALGFIRINSQLVKVSQKIKPYDEVSIIMPYPPTPELMAEDIPLDIAHEDDDLILINKPPGLVCHPGAGNYRGTLINALLYHFQHMPLPVDRRQAYRPGLVHRIDKDTSGLLVIAKNEVAFNHLSKQFYERTTDRLYYALVWGNIPHDRGTIVGHIGRMPNDRKRYMVYEDGTMGKHAVTHYQVLERFGVVTLVRCKLETGRTHQIRVHFKYIGHTLFGDRFYGGARMLRGRPSNAYKRLIEDCLATLPRQALHAATLGFIHPRTGEYAHYSSDLPADFRLVLDKFAGFMQRDPVDELVTDLRTPEAIDAANAATTGRQDSIQRYRALPDPTLAADFPDDFPALAELDAEEDEDLGED